MSYPGGKGNCWREILNRMPYHEVYIETHLGGGSVLKNKRPARSSIAIDVDPLVLREFADGPGQDLPATSFVCGDAATWLERVWTFRGDELVYADPPYMMETRKDPDSEIYRHEYTVNDHIRLLSALQHLPCHVMISGYRSEVYDKILRTWRREDFTNATRAGRVTESVWMNFDADKELHEYGHIGEGFRERERIKKQQRRWTARFQRLPEAEQHGMLRALLAAVPPEMARAAAEEVYGKELEERLAAFSNKPRPDPDNRLIP